jgi:hypothetical protein
VATARQIEANRRNAQMSTGPVTDGGKSISKRNSLKHGLAAVGAVLPEEMEAEVRKRVEDWRPEIGPAGPYDEWMLRVAVVASVQADHAVSHEINLRNHLSQRARCRWDEDRHAKAEETAAGLSKDPARVVSRLEGTKQGCEWLIGRWQGLALALEVEGTWTEAQTALALDLLGTPHVLRVRPLRPSAELVDEEIGRLAGLIESGLDGLDEHERVSAELGMGMDTPRELSLAQRYREACFRRVRSALQEIKKGRGPSSASSPPTFAPVSRPTVRLDDPPRPESLEDLVATFHGALPVRASVLPAAESAPLFDDEVSFEPPPPLLLPATIAPPPSPRLNRRARRAQMKQMAASKR